MLRLKGYYFITDSLLSRAGNESDIKSALACGITAIQYRRKGCSTKEMFDEASRLRQLIKSALYIINDRLDIALSVGADGLHLGHDDMPYAAARKLLGKKKIIGLTVHTLKEAEEAQSLGADYVGVSPVFTTKTKKDAGKPIGIELLAQLRKRLVVPIVAIGGLNLSNAKSVIRAGADCICAISAVVTQPDVKKEIQKYQRLFS